MSRPESDYVPSTDFAAGRFTAFGGREAARAKHLGLTPYEFAGYQGRLREDYKAMLPSSRFRPRTSLGMGLMPLLANPEPIAQVGFGRVPPWLFPLLDALAVRFAS